MSGWQPIETAPKDGRTIFIWRCGECTKAAYLTSHHGHIPQWYVLDMWRNWTGLLDTPKWWMPLPQPPTAKCDPDAEQLLKDAIDDLPDPSQGTGPFSPTSLQVIRVKDARKKLWRGT